MSKVTSRSRYINRSPFKRPLKQFGLKSVRKVWNIHSLSQNVAKSFRGTATFLTHPVDLAYIVKMCYEHCIVCHSITVVNLRACNNTTCIFRYCKENTRVITAIRCTILHGLHTMKNHLIQSMVTPCGLWAPWTVLCSFFDAHMFCPREFF